MRASSWLILGVLLLIAAAPARAQFSPGPNPITSMVGGQTISTGTGTVNSGGTISTSGSTIGVSVTGTAAIVNNGTIQTNTGRGIVDSGSGITVTVTNNAGALIQTTSADALRISGSGNSAILYNYGSINSINTAAGGSQAVDWNSISTGSNTLYNYAGGSLTAAEADAVRPGVNGVIYNSGTIKSTTSTGSSSDGIDGQTNITGITITNAASQTAGSGAANLIEGARHGITGGQEVDTAAGGYNLNFAMTITNNAGGTIKGDNGSGINIDGVSKKELVHVTNAGTITGNGVTGDGDGIDVDGLIDLNNSGTIQSKNAFVSTGIATSEGVTTGGGTIVNSGTIQGSVASGNLSAVGRGITVAGIDKTVTGGVTTDHAVDPIYDNTTITNNNGGLIKGDSSYGIGILGGHSGFTTTINNNAGAAIEGGGTDAAITVAADDVTINNAGTITATGTGKAIDLGNGTGNSVNITGGSASVTGGISGSTSNPSTLTMSPGTGNSFNYSGAITNFTGVQVTGGGTVTLSGTSTYLGGTSVTGGTLKVSGSIATSAVTLGSGSVLTGGGTVGALTISSGGILSPGNSPGTLHAGNTVFNTGGIYVLQVQTDGTGTAGNEWDQLAISGTLDLSSLTSAGTFQFDLRTLNGSGNPGALDAFDPAANHTWNDVIATTGGVTGFDPAKFTFITSNFVGANGTFTLVQDPLNSGNLDLQYTAAGVPEPATWALLIGGGTVLVVVVRRRRLAT